MQELKALHDKMVADLDKIKTAAAPLRKELDELNEKMRPFEIRARELTLKIKALEQPFKGNLEKQIFALKMALNKTTPMVGSAVAAKAEANKAVAPKNEDK